MNSLFLYSLLKDDYFLSEEVVQKVIKHFRMYDNKGYDNLIDNAEQFVFFKNETDSVLNVRAILSLDVNDSNWFYSKVGLTIDKSVFPKDKEILRNEDLINSYQKCALALLGKNMSLESFATNLFYLQKFFLSSFRPTKPSIDTVSQFEFVKSRAAFAQVLSSPYNEEDPFLLMCGDLSGIQDFIYNIHSSKAYKSIKGRSFYLQLIVETVISHVLDKTQMPVSNIIYSSGGKFYALLPNNEDIINKLKSLDNDLQQAIWEKFHLGIYLCLGWIPFKIGDNYRIITKSEGNITGLGDLWKAVSENAAQQKSKKFNKILSSNFNEIFSASSDNYNGEGMTICAVSGVPIEESDENLISSFDDEDPIYVEQSIKEQVLLGKKLRDCNVINVSKKSFLESVNPLGLDYFFGLTKSPIAGNENDYILLNPSSEEEYNLFVERYGSAKFLFYGGSKPVLTDKGKIASLETIAKPIDNTKMNKIAVLKMDVDNLGQLFTKREKQRYTTFAAMSDLSTRLDWFFSGYVNSIRDNEFSDNVNVIYAGGDDLCAVGKWDKVLEFGDRIRKDFREYIGESEKHTLSAGYIICNPKFTISKAIKLADKELDNAKKYKINKIDLDAKKNAISLFDNAIYWQNTNTSNKEWNLVMNLAKYLFDNLSQGKISKGLIYQLHSFNTIKNDGMLDWQWKSAYYFAKMNIKDELLKQEMKQLSSAIITGQIDFLPQKEKFNADRFFELLIVAAKIADYKTR